MENHNKPSEDEKLVMSFEPNTIEHLGIKMYSHVPPALSELIANSYDACATIVSVKLYDGENSKIIVEDNGTGMSFREVNNHFLRIGRNRRKENQKASCNRIPTGKKGLGKLALFGIGTKITIITIHKNQKITFILVWGDILNWDNKDYTPAFTIQATQETSGTTMIVENLKRKTGFPISDYAVSIAKLFNFKAEDFQVSLSLNEGEAILINNKLKYENIIPEFSWDFNEIVKLFESNYEEKDKIVGEIITTEKPLPPGLRGITLFANGRMVNLPEFFGRSESSYFFSYVTGWLDVDFLDAIDEDVISTDRQSINWEHEKTIPLKEFLSNALRHLENKWRDERKEKRRRKIKEKTNVDIPTWLGNLPANIREKLEPILLKVDDSELSQSDQTETINNLHDLVPDYPYFHWRHLHPAIQDAARNDYENEDYYRAFTEAVKRYISATRSKSASVGTTDSGMMGQVYGRASTLSVTASFKKPDGTDFHIDTLEGIEEGQKLMSMGIVAGGRNPISHEEITDLRDSGLFSEKDCLDGLSLLSHLFRRLECC